MKIHISEVPQRKHGLSPKQPAVSLSKPAYAKLLALSDQHNISMRKLASAIILEACSNLDIEKVGATDGD